MKIIIEGIDGAGKSTIAKELSNALGYEIYHSTYLTQNDMEFWTNFIDKQQDGIINDRSFISTYIYEPVINGIPKLNEKEFATLLTKTSDYVIIYVGDSIESCEMRAFSRGEDYISKEQFKVIYNEYYKWDMLSQLREVYGDNVMFCNIDNKDDVISKVLELHYNETIRKES